jgi:hypothetical protein
MLECTKCADKLKCVTGEKKSCNRGFQLPMCCRKYLSGKKQEIIAFLIDCPNEMIDGDFLVYKDICPECNSAIHIRLQMALNLLDPIKQLIDRFTKQQDDNKFVNPFINPNPNIPYPNWPNMPNVWTTTTGGTVTPNITYTVNCANSSMSAMGGTTMTA